MRQHQELLRSTETTANQYPLWDSLLADDAILEEDQVERVSALIAESTGMEGSSLENTVLEVLWKHRTKTSPSSPPLRKVHTVIRRPSPAKWVFPARTTITPSSSQGGTPPTTAAYPDTAPSLSDSPSSLSLSDFSDTVPIARKYRPESFADYLSEYPSEYPMEYAAQYSMEYANDYYKYMYAAPPIAQDFSASTGTSPSPTLPYASTQPPTLICRFFLSDGHCLRADCRFSHELGATICKYWVNGCCLAGDTCAFSHDPNLISAAVDQEESLPVQYQELQYASSFPQLTPFGMVGPPITPPGFKALPHLPAVPPVDDSEAFPSLGSAKSSPQKKHNRRLVKESETAATPSLAELVRLRGGPKTFCPGAPPK